jgi:hypothetical protein
MKLWVNVCFHYVPERLPKFYQLIENINKFKTKGTKIIINSNTNFDDNLPIKVSVLDDPFHLTWEHKKDMQAFLESDYTHFVYLEGNLNLTQKNLNYWCKYREFFKNNNLNFIPAIHRVQIGKDGRTYSLDSTRHVNKNPSIEVQGKKFISLPEAYQGMFIMDREMVQEHINSDFFKLGQKGWFGIRESANLGNMFINVPAGFPHRALVPLDNFDECCAVHNGTDYHGDFNSPHAKIPVTELFV